MTPKSYPKQIAKISVFSPGLHSSAFYIVSASLSVLFLFREFFISGKIPGDTGDARLTFTLLNHWYRVFTFQEGLTQQIFFWPDSNTLGSSEALLGPGILNTLLRFMQVSFLNSGIWTWILYAFILFLGVFNFAKTNFRSNFVALLFTLLIAFSYGLNTKIVHLHLIGFLMTFFLISCYQNLLRNNVNFLYVFGGLAGPFLFALSCWYGFMGSLIGFAFTMLSYVLLFGIKALRGQFHTFKGLFLTAFKNCQIGFIFSTFVALSLGITWALIYIPFVSRTSSSWNFSEVVIYSPRLGDLVNSSSGAFGPWNNFFEFLNLSTSPSGERALGFTPLLFISFLYLIYVTLISFRSIRIPAFERVLVLATLILMVVMLTDDAGHSLWYLLYNFIPGASSLRAIFRLNLFLAWAITFVLFSYFLRIWRNSKFSLVKTVAFSLIIIGLFLESVRISPASWSLDQFLPREYSAIKGELNSRGCAAFYLFDNSLQRGSVKTHGDAIAVATYTGIPTINGASSQSIPSWNALSQPNKATLEAELRLWLKAYNMNLSGNVCVIKY